MIFTALALHLDGLGTLQPIHTMFRCVGTLLMYRHEALARAGMARRAMIVTNSFAYPFKISGTVAQHTK